MLLRESAKVGGAGLLAGLTLAVAIAPGLVGTLYGVAVDGWLFASMAAAAGAGDPRRDVAAGAPAARVEPTAALRDE